MLYFLYEYSVLPNEIIVKEGPANATRGMEGVGGKLYLTNQRLIFESHAINFQTGTTEINITDITESGIGRTMLFKLFRFTPNMFYVVSNGQRFEFTVYGRKKWKEALDSIRPR